MSKSVDSQPSTSSQTPDLLVALRDLFAPGLIIGGLQLMGTYPILGVITVYFGFAVAAAEVIWEPWVLRRHYMTRMFLLGAVLTLCSIFTICLPKEERHIAEIPKNPQPVIQPSPNSSASSSPVKSRTEIPEDRPYELSVSREKRFLQLLKKPQSEPRDILRIGCAPNWSEKSCVVAAKFLMEFSEAGWTIDSDKVFRMETQIPNAGVTICTNFVPPGPKLPPHLGRWAKMDASQVTLFCAMLGIGIPVYGASDTELPTGTLGISDRLIGTVVV